MPILLQLLLLELLAVALATTQTTEQQQIESSKYYGNLNASKIVEIYKSECHVFVNRDAKWVYRTKENQVTLLNAIQYQLLLEKCHLSDTVDHETEHEDSDGMNFLDGNTFLTSGTNSTMESGNSTEGTPIIYPGTKWCGRGAIARSYDDIGLYAHTDQCCRDHDNCPDNILAGESKHGLQNEAAFTSSSCECDDKFLNCLKSDRTLSKLTSSKIAQIYFNILKPLCFAERHPTKGCHQTRLTGECIRPDYDYKQAQKWQFFAAQPYFAKTVRGLLDTFNNIFGPTESPVPDPSSHSGRRSLAMPPGFTF